MKPKKKSDPINAEAVSKMRRLAPIFASGGRLIILNEGINAFRDAFELRETKSKPRELQALTGADARDAIYKIADAFVGNLKRVKKQELLIAAEWAVFCTSKALNGEVHISDESPYDIGTGLSARGVDADYPKRIYLLCCIASAANGFPIPSTNRTAGS